MKVLIRCSENDDNWGYHGTKSYRDLCNILKHGFSFVRRREIDVASTKEIASGYGPFIVKVNISHLSIKVLDHNPDDVELNSYRNICDGVRYSDQTYILDDHKLNLGARSAVLHDDRIFTSFSIPDEYDPFCTTNKVIKFEELKSNHYMYAVTKISEEIENQISYLNVLGVGLPCFIGLSDDKNSIVVIPSDLLDFGSRANFALVDQIEVDESSIKLIR